MTSAPCAYVHVHCACWRLILQPNVSRAPVTSSPCACVHVHTVHVHKVRVPTGMHNGTCACHMCVHMCTCAPAAQSRHGTSARAAASGLSVARLTAGSSPISSSAASSSSEAAGHARGATPRTCMHVHAHVHVHVHAHVHVHVHVHAFMQVHVHAYSVHVHAHACSVHVHAHACSVHVHAHACSSSGPREKGGGSPRTTG